VIVCTVGNFALAAAGGALVGVVVAAWATYRVMRWINKNAR
jgi:hypothetical protein